MSARLDRTTFSTSRLLDFCNRKELIAQTGHQPDAWPLVVLKELVDNALDACEETEVAPEVTIPHRGGHDPDHGPRPRPTTALQRPCGRPGGCPARRPPLGDGAARRPHSRRCDNKWLFPQNATQGATQRALGAPVSLVLLAFFGVCTKPIS